MDIRKLGAFLFSHWGQSLALSLICLVLLGSIFATPGVAADTAYPQFNSQLSSNSVGIETRPKTPWVKPGQEVTYEIYAHPEGEATVAAEIRLSYGSDLELVEVKPGPYLGERTIPGPAIIDAENRVSIHVWARIGSPLQPPAPGVLAYVTFRAASGNPWNNWVRQEVELVDANLEDTQHSSTSFQLHVYHRLPIPQGLTPGNESGFHGTGTGRHAAFRVRTFSPANMLYRIEVSGDSFKSIAHTFDQTASTSGWDQQRYQNGQEAEFVAPEALEPGSYQWRAYAWIEQIDQWTPPSEALSFEVLNQTIGLTRVTPRVIYDFQEHQIEVVVEGWGFLPGATVILWPFRGNPIPVTVERLSNGKLSVTIPREVEAGLASLQVKTPRRETASSTVLVMPLGLYTVTANVLPASNEVIAGRPFHVSTYVSNWGSDVESVALVAVNLPDPSVFELVDIKPGASVELIAQDQDMVLLAVIGGSFGNSGNDSSVAYEFRLRSDAAVLPATGEEPSAGHDDSPDFLLKPVVLGEVSRPRWEQMRLSMSIGSLVRTVESETDENLRKVSETFNDVPWVDLQTYLGPLLTSEDSYQVIHLITRMQGNGLDMSKIFSALSQLPEETQVKIFREYQYATGVWP